MYGDCGSKERGILCETEITHHAARDFFSEIHAVSNFLRAKKLLMDVLMGVPPRSISRSQYITSASTSKCPSKLNTPVSAQLSLAHP